MDFPSPFYFNYFCILARNRLKVLIPINLGGSRNFSLYYLLFNLYCCNYAYESCLICLKIGLFYIKYRFFILIASLFFSSSFYLFLFVSSTSAVFNLCFVVTWSWKLLVLVVCSILGTFSCILCGIRIRRSSLFVTSLQT